MKIFIPLFLVLSISSAFAQDENPDQYSIPQLDSILDVFIDNNAFQKMLPYAQVAVEKSEKLLEKQDTMYAKMHYFLGVAYYRNENFPNAEKHLRIALEVQKSKTPKSPNYINTLNSLANIHNDLGNYELSESLYKQALALRKEISGENHPRYASILNNYANLLSQKGEYAAAEPLYREFLRVNKALHGQKHLYVVFGLLNLGNLYSNLENYALAEPLFKESAEVAKTLGGENDTYYAMCITNLASLYYRMENYTLAEPLFKEALRIKKATVGEKHNDYAISLHNLGGLYVSTKQYDLAEPMFKEALKVKSAFLSKTHPNYVITLQNLAVLYKSTKQYQLSENLFKEALASYKDFYGAQNREYLGCFNSLISMYLEKSDYPNALNSIHQSLAANSQLNISLNISQNWADSILAIKPSSFENFMTTLDYLYAVLEYDSLANQRKERQMIIASLALELLQKKRSDFADESDKMRLLAGSSEWVLRNLNVIDKKAYPDKAFAFAEVNKGVLLMESAKASQAYIFGNLPDSLVRQEKFLQKKQSDLEAQLTEKNPTINTDSLLDILNKTKLEVSDFSKSLKAKYPKYMALKYENKPIQATDIQSALDEKTAILEYVVGTSATYIFYLDKKQMKVYEYNISLDSLKLKINLLHNSLSQYKSIINNEKKSYANYTTTAHWFYKNFLAESLQNAKGIEHLVIIPDGELSHLPFEVFLVRPANQSGNYQDLHYLIKDFKISYNYSAALWKENLASQNRKNNGKLFAVAANYEWNNDDTLSFRLPADQRLRKLLSPLPAARGEVEALKTKFDGSFVFDSLASEQYFKKNAQEYGIIHLAMHGLLDKKSPILSSLAFTEDANKSENNFLQAYEISKMELNADLVVLSACETGFGKFEKGNGTASLARAFMYAGVPALVVSLWSVNDASTAKIMQFFYENLSNGLDKSESLRQAKLKYLSEANGIAAHPAFWSAFVQIGNSQAIPLNNKTPVPYWVVGIVGLLGVGAVFLKNRKR